MHTLTILYVFVIVCLHLYVCVSKLLLEPEQLKKFSACVVPKSIIFCQLEIELSPSLFASLIHFFVIQVLVSVN